MKCFYLLSWINVLLHELLNLQQNFLAFSTLMEELSRNAVLCAAEG